MVTVSMATLLEQPLPTTSQKIRDVIFKDKMVSKSLREKKKGRGGDPEV